MLLISLCVRVSKHPLSPRSRDMHTLQPHPSQVTLPFESGHNYETLSAHLTCTCDMQQCHSFVEICSPNKAKSQMIHPSEQGSCWLGLTEVVTGPACAERVSAVRTVIRPPGSCRPTFGDIWVHRFTWQKAAFVSNRCRPIGLRDLPAEDRTGPTLNV